MREGERERENGRRLPGLPPSQKHIHIAGAPPNVIQRRTRSSESLVAAWVRALVWSLIRVLRTFVDPQLVPTRKLRVAVTALEGSGIRVTNLVLLQVARQRKSLVASRKLAFEWFFIVRLVVVSQAYPPVLRCTLCLGTPSGRPKVFLVALQSSSGDIVERNIQSLILARKQTEHCCSRGIFI